MSGTGTGADAVWAVEERFWLAGGDERATIDPHCIMAFESPTGVVTGDQVTAALAATPRFDAVSIEDRTLAEHEGGVVVLGYRAEARRGDEEPDVWFCTSTYRRAGEGFVLLQHAQAPG